MKPSEKLRPFRDSVWNEETGNFGEIERGKLRTIPTTEFPRCFDGGGRSRDRLVRINMHSCPVDGCDYCTPKSCNVYSHLASRHKWSKEQLEELKKRKAEEAEAEKKSNESLNPFPCPHCETRSKTLKVLQQHIRRNHEDERPNYNTVCCPISDCEDRFRTRELLANHCAAIHPTDEAPFDVKNQLFMDSDDFKEWKELIENQTRASFTIESTHGNLTYYWCSRGNRDRRNEDSIKPKMSKRVISYCPAFINVCRRDDGAVSATFCLDHLGHDTKLAKIPLNSTEMNHLFSIIDQGLDFATLKEELRKHGRTSRMFWLTEKQIRRYVYRRRNSKFQFNTNDHQSVVDRFEAGESSGIRMVNYDPADTNATRIVIITDEQVDWIKKYGRRCIVIDDTFRTTRHSIRLTTFLVLDELDRGLPAAHMLSYHVTEAEVAILFKEVLKLVPDFDTAFFMSDAAGALHNGFKRALPHSTATRLICMWHWKKFIKEQVMTKYKDDRDRGNSINATIHRLCGILDRTEFNVELNSLMSSLSDTEGDGFARYFRSWARDRDVWAPYNRRDSPVNTSMISEAYHKVLKHKWLPKKGRARLDELVHCLLWVPGEIEEEKEIEDEQGLFGGKYRMMESYKRHRSAVNGYKDHTEKVERITRMKWNVQSEKADSVYIVTDKGEDKCDCDETNLHCYGCSACPRRFDCSCIDGRKAGITCKHIHACLLYSSHQDIDDLPPSVPTIQQQRNLDLDLTHDYSHRNEQLDNTVLMMDDEEQDEESREREEKEQRTAHLYQESYKLLTEAKRRIDAAKRKNDDGKLEDFVAAMKEALKELDELDGRGNVPLPNRARGHVTFIPALIGKRGRRRNVEDTSSQPLRVLQPDEMETCNHCLLRIAPRRGERSMMVEGEDQNWNRMGIENRDDEGEDEWVQCNNCPIWTHVVCCPSGSMCESCLNGIMGHE